MATTTTRVAVIDEPAVSVEDMTRSLRFLASTSLCLAYAAALVACLSFMVTHLYSTRIQDRTGLFFKRVSQFRAPRRKSQEDRKASTGPGTGFAVFPRKARSMDITNKAFSMSQPVLGVASEHSMTDNDEASDSNATTAGSSPTPRKPKLSHPTPTLLPTKPAAARTQAVTIKAPPLSNADSTPRVLAPSGLPAVSRGAAPTQSSEGLPVEDAPSWVWIDSNAAASAKNANTNSTVTGPSVLSTITATVPSAALVQDLADCGSHGSDEVRRS